MLAQMPGPSCSCHLLWTSFPSQLPQYTSTFGGGGGVALNPALHFTFSTILLCLCVWGDVRESSSILGPRDVACGYSIVFIIEQVLD